MSLSDAPPALNPNLAARITELAVQHPDRLALVEYPGRRVRWSTFGELAGNVAMLAGGMRARGIVPGDAVLLALTPSIDLFTGILACLHVGARGYVVEDWMDRRRLEAAITQVEPQALLGTGPARLVRVVSGAARDIPIQMLTTRRLPHARYGSAVELEPPHEASPTDIALVRFAADPADASPLIAWTHGTLESIAARFAAYLERVPSDIDMPGDPAFTIGNLISGTTSVLPAMKRRLPGRPAKPQEASAICRQLAVEGVTSFSASSELLVSMARHCEDRGDRIRLRALAYTNLDPALGGVASDLAAALGPAALMLFASRRAGPVLGIPAGELRTAEPGDPTDAVCLGRPAPDVRLRLVRPGTQEVLAEWDAALGSDFPAALNGELEFSAASVAVGLEALPPAGEPPAAASAWARTGCTARLDPSGRVWLRNGPGGSVSA